MKSQNYALKFKCSQNIRSQSTRKVDISLEWIVEIFKTQILEAKWTIVHIRLQQTGINFVGECTAFSPKNLMLWKLSLFKTFLSSKWNILYQSCYCVKCVTSCFLLGNIGVFKICFQAFHYWMWWNQYDSVLWYKQMSLGKCTDPNGTKGI